MVQCSCDRGVDPERSGPGRAAGRAQDARHQAERRSDLPIELFRWEHRPSVVNLPLIDRWKRRAIPNFGDEIGPIIVRALLAERRLPAPEESRVDGRLISVGSVFHFARPGDHVWGTGINAKRQSDFVKPSDVHIHAVRGPRTADELERLGFDVPRVYGDPALLLRKIPEVGRLVSSEKRRRVALIPNFNDLGSYRGHPDLVSPLQDPISVARIIAESEFVVGSSLHAMVFADALGVPSRLIASANEHPFKYEDYYLGSGREPQTAASSLEDALRMGPVDQVDFDPEPLLAAFPEALFSGPRSLA